MKKSTLVLLSASALATLALGVAVPAHAATASTGTTVADITFAQNTNPTPVDPGSPTDPVTPDPGGEVPGTPGALSLVEVPNFHFGTHALVTSDETYHAYATAVTTTGTTPTTSVRNPYVQVSDLRGGVVSATDSTPAVNWSVLVTQDTNWTGPNALAGSELDFTTSQTLTTELGTNPAGLTTQNAAKLTPGSAVDLYSYNGGTTNVPGAKNNLLSFGAADGSDVASTDPSANPDTATSPYGYTNGVTLKVPATANAQVGTYSTNLTWTLQDTPDFS